MKHTKQFGDIRITWQTNAYGVKIRIASVEKLVRKYTGMRRGKELAYTERWEHVGL